MAWDVYFDEPFTGEGTKVRPQRIYIDTSIVGGFFDEEFEKETKLLFQRLEDREVVFVVSNVLIDELRNAPSNVKHLLDEYDERLVEKVVSTDEARELAQKYIAEKVVGKASLDDCMHIAVATINKADVLASWNFKHIVNLERIRGYNSVNLKNGYTPLEIRNPKELIDYGEDV